MLRLPPKRDYSKGKTKKVAWFASNPVAKRKQYVQELAKYINVDIYGKCGNLSCPRNKEKECYNLLKTTYKFYLSFENSQCHDYITEKLYVNALQNDILPIVMGPPYEDYKIVAPEGSFIHVDQFKSPKELADYLHILDKDDELYNSYFQWKSTGKFIDTKFWCRVCAMLHGPPKPKHYPDYNQWWRHPKICKPK